MNPERDRLEESRVGKQPWRKWGPYVSERQWGTVREDYSANGDAWNYITHDAARSRAYRWGEDGLAGFCDDQQHLCLGLALWNGRDPILKERLFGLNNSEGNHGEDVKELYYYLDATPTHSYLKMLYKYPQGEFPYERLIEENARRSKLEMEFELIDTGLFDENRYFDVFVEYAKAAPEDLLMRITVHNRGPEASRLHLLPQIWFRNTWSWQTNALRPSLVAVGTDPIAVTHPVLGKYWLHVQDKPDLLLCDNDTNVRRLFGDSSAHGFFKDAFHDYLIRGEHGAVNPDRSGTKAAAHYDLTVSAGESVCVRLRLTNAVLPDPMGAFDAAVEERRSDADAFYADLQKDLSDPDARSVQRQAWAGMIWSKQYYGYDVPHVAGWRSERTRAADRTAAGTQPRLAAPQ